MRAPLEFDEARLLAGELGVELADARHVLLDAPDLLGARTAEVAVVGEHASGARRVALVQQQLQRLLAADLLRRAQLRGERLAFAGQRRLALLAFARELDATAAALAALASQPRHLAAHAADGLLGTAQVAGQTVALGGIATDLAADALDFLLDLAQFGFGFRPVGLGAALSGRHRPLGPGSRRQVHRRRKNQQQQQEGSRKTRWRAQAAQCNAGSGSPAGRVGPNPI